MTGTVVLGLVLLVLDVLGVLWLVERRRSLTLTALAARVVAWGRSVWEYLTVPSHDEAIERAATAAEAEASIDG